MTPDLFAEYRERGFHWAEGRQIRPGEIEPPTYWGWHECARGDAVDALERARRRVGDALDRARGVG